MSSRLFLPSLVVLGACIGGVTGGGGGERASDPTAVAITAPDGAAIVPRDYLTGAGGWAAPLAFTAKAMNPEVVRVEWVEHGVALGIGAAPDFRLATELTAEGAHTVEAIGVDADGEEVGRTQVTFTVIPPTAAGGDCHEQLLSLGQDYDPAAATPGIDDPVTVHMPLNGMPFTYLGQATPRKDWLMDCNMALALWRTVDVMRKAGVVAATDIGIYNYRCMDGTVPPCTTSSLSMHAEGLAVDIAGFTMADGSTYSVETDWIIDTLPSGENTCTVTPQPGLKNQVMHALLCSFYADRIYTIMLTPNYNSAHRNHFHLDLTPQSGIIAK